MSSHIIPKEHRVRKNKVAFERSKQLFKDDLYNGKSTDKKLIKKLDRKALARSKKKLHLKQLKEVLFVIFVIIPAAILGVKLFLDYIKHALG